MGEHTNNLTPFFSRPEGQQRYHSVVACAIKSSDQQISTQIDTTFNMVLCIDCVEKDSYAFGDLVYMEKLIRGLAIFFADIQVSFEISNQDLSNWVQNQLAKFNE